MSLSFVALDYSRPLLSLFKPATSTGRVHSIFRRVINIAFSDTVVSIASEELQRTPNSIRITCAHMNAMFRIVEKDMNVWIENEKLSIPACGCTISLPNMKPWEPKPDIRCYSWDHELIIQHTNLLIDFLIAESDLEGLGILAVPLLRKRASHQQCRRDQMYRVQSRFIGSDPNTSYAASMITRDTSRVDAIHVVPTMASCYQSFRRGVEAKQDGSCSVIGNERVYGEMPLHTMALPLLRLLMLASWQQDRGGIERAVKGLTGLGPGLTPSGDDVLAGFAAVLFLLSEQLSIDGVSRRYIAELIAAIACPRTTLLSVSFLACAARGEVSESLGHLLIGLTLPLVESETLLKAAERVLDFGASSGSDTLLGVLAGLRTLEGEQDYGFTSSA